MVSISIDCSNGHMGNGKREEKKESFHSTKKKNKWSYVFTLKLTFVIHCFKGLVINWAYSLDWKCEEGFSFARVHKAAFLVLVAFVIPRASGTGFEPQTEASSGSNRKPQGKAREFNRSHHKSEQNCEFDLTSKQGREGKRRI